MNLSTRITAIALFGLAAVAGYAFWEHHVEQLGAAKVEARDAKLALAATDRVIEQLKRDFKTNEDAVNGLQAENDRLAAAVAAAPAPTLRLCVSPPGGGSGLPAAAGTTGGAGSATTAGRDGAEMPTGAVAGPDIGQQLRTVALVADELSAQLRAMQQREIDLQP